MIFPPLIAAAILFGISVVQFLFRDILLRIDPGPGTRHLAHAVVIARSNLGKRARANALVFVAFVLAPFLSHDAGDPLTIAAWLIRFADLGLVFIAIALTVRLALNAPKIAKTFPWISTSALDDEQKPIQARQPEGWLGIKEMITIADQATEVRRTCYYDSAFLILLIGLYLSVFCALPDRLIHCNLWIVVITLAAAAVVLVQMPYAIGQKRLELALLRPCDAVQRRERRKLLSEMEPSRHLPDAARLVGFGFLGPIVILAFDRLIKIWLG
jgi:hypothetical protein